MTHGTELIIVAAIVVLAAALALAICLKVLGSKKTTGDVTKKTFLTSNELEFLGRLEAAVPEYRFHAQVAMGALLEPVISTRANRSEHFRVRAAFSQKIVDFVAQDRTNGELVAIVELDDRTHDARKDAKRDQLLERAGYRSIRWSARAKPNSEEIRRQLISPSR